MVSKKPEDPQLEPMASDTITWSGIQGLGSPLYICGVSILYMRKKQAAIFEPEEKNISLPHSIAQTCTTLPTFIST